jgi:hypothetical protein
LIRVPFVFREHFPEHRNIATAAPTIDVALDQCGGGTIAGSLRHAVAALVCPFHNYG